MFRIARVTYFSNEWGEGHHLHYIQALDNTCDLSWVEREQKEQAQKFTNMEAFTVLLQLNGDTQKNESEHLYYFAEIIT